VLHCSACHGKLRRVHRTFDEKLLYAAMYECGKCHTRKPEPRWYALYLGDYPRCPRCGTYRLTRLATPDKIDRMHSGLVNFVQYAWGAELYHCRYCRVQFYDVRKPVAPEIREKTGVPAPVTVAASAQASAADLAG
jgi:DNA-directed RNA polymerase subunit RPC12/RpoP